jgi:putative sterol carrier protein
MDPEQFAALVREASDEQLQAGLDANRQLILGEIFRRMPEQLDPRRAAGVQAVVEWRILDPARGADDVWHLVIGDGSCEVREGGADAPTVIYEIGGVDFIRLITGEASGPKLFLFGRLKIRGNLLLAARMPGFFAIPGAEE